MIDAKLNAESGKAVLEEIAKTIPMPVTHMIQIHSDGDHVNGLTAFPAGVVIVTHEGAKRAAGFIASDHALLPLGADVAVTGHGALVTGR